MSDRSQHEFVAPERGEILYDKYGIWYWSPTGEPGTWAYPYGEGFDGVFTPDATPGVPWLDSLAARFPLRVEFPLDNYVDGTHLYGNHAVI